MRIFQHTILLSSLICSYFILPKSQVHFLIQNESNKEVRLNITFSPTDQSEQKLTFSASIPPGLREMEAGKIKNGTYQILANTSDGITRFQITQSVDTEKWFVFSFIQNDSLSIGKKYGYVDTSFLKKIDGKYTGISFYAENRRPIGF